MVSTHVVSSLVSLILPMLCGLRGVAAVISQSQKKSSSKQALRQALVDDKYIWPSGTGRIEQYTLSPSKAPRDLSKGPSWNWTDPRGRYRAVPGGANIDHESNIYMLALDGIRKFSPDGQLIWSFTPDREHGEEMPDMSSLYRGAVYVSTTKGRVYAVSMDKGEVIWMTKLASCDGNNGWVSVEEGTVILGSDAAGVFRGEKTGRIADQYVSGLSAADGKVLWKYKPDAPVWNFMGSFAGDGTFTFQDYEGRAYRNKVSDGTNIWKTGGFNYSWTDASAMLGLKKIVYAMNNRGLDGGRDHPGDVSAYRLKDGKLLWRQEVPRPPNNMPAVGQLVGHKGLSLVQPIGQQVMKGAPTDIYVFDAETGERRWTFNGPSQKDDLQAGDSNPEAQEQRSLSNVRAKTYPNPWSAPTIDANGVVFIGSEEGGFYSLRDLNGDGIVDGDEEVSVFDTGACFSGSSAAAIAPGFIVATSIDAMYVFESQAGVAKSTQAVPSKSQAGVAKSTQAVRGKSRDGDADSTGAMPSKGQAVVAIGAMPVVAIFIHTFILATPMG